jgi:RNA polymerase sigma-70 factor (ECF subfamily)
MTAATALARKVEEKCSADQRWAELLREIAAGNQEALAELYDRTNRTVFSLALRVLNDRGAAEEVTLDAYLQVWRQAQVYDERRGKPLAWLLTIARNKAIDRLRSATWKRHEQEPLDEAAPVAVSVESPEEAAAGAETRRQVRAALARLKPEQRELIEIAYFGGLSQQEIADQSGLPLGTVKTRMRTGMLKLRELLSGVVAISAPAA